MGRRLIKRETGVGRLLGSLGRTFAETTRGFSADRGSDLSASLAFATLVMLVPLIATFSFLLAAVFEQKDAAIYNALNAVLPYQSATLTRQLREFARSAQTISRIGIVFLLLTSLRLIFVVEGVVNAVWGAPKRKGLVGRMAVFTLGLVVTALFLAIAVAGIALARSNPRLSPILSSALAAQLFAILLSLSALTLLYKFMPNARVRWRRAFAAGLTAALGLKLLRLLLGAYVRKFTAINVVYGSLAVLFLFLISLYLFWVIVLWGVELAHVLDRRAAARAE